MSLASALEHQKEFSRLKAKYEKASIDMSSYILNSAQPPAFIEKALDVALYNLREYLDECNYRMPSTKYLVCQGCGSVKDAANEKRLHSLLSVS